MLLKKVATKLRSKSIINVNYTFYEIQKIYQLLNYTFYQFFFQNSVKFFIKSFIKQSLVNHATQTASMKRLKNGGTFCPISLDSLGKNLFTQVQTTQHLFAVPVWAALLKFNHNVWYKCDDFAYMDVCD